MIRSRVKLLEIDKEALGAPWEEPTNAREWRDESVIGLSLVNDGFGPEKY